MVHTSFEGVLIIKVKILVAAHKAFPMPDDKTLYLPVLVGAKQNYRSGITYQRDDEGKNISYKNTNYNELTAVYWAWKNLTGVDAIGLVHYRRMFFLKRSRKLEDVLKLSDVTHMLEKYDVVLPNVRKYYIESNYSHYVHAHEKMPLLKLREVISDTCPDYLISFDDVMRRRQAHMFNMFIMKREKFDDYCKWIFEVLHQLEIRIDISGYSDQEKRVFGYLSELLMDVWIDKNEINYGEVQWRQLGKRHPVKKVFFFMLRKLNLGGKVTHF
ncbi:hypothetical protein FD28_GL000755 [Levilactobacillus hammesii DSM 16381]|uniref:DUF4422 domain-containing protein n=1 Tax=Levilactobacillus hammesii DSM 16381 TaxID=1423753 RepID=A0A0R1UW00_9LACO|nr:hypothetical protein FD28_GL000755 [Levilactobacillus hammesii DSM 16381]